MFLLGYDVGSSSVKASLVSTYSGECVASDFFPKKEAPIRAVKPGWAEQDPKDWWQYLKDATRSVLCKAKENVSGFTSEDISAIGISWQMHGLVCVDKDLNVLRDAIIWCDSRAAEYGDRAFEALGEDYCLGHLLNSPGNFTASKLAWVKENEKDIFDRIHKIMLPGDYIAMKLSGTVTTTAEGLSEGTLWDFQSKDVAWELMDYFGFPHDIIPDIVPNFGLQQTVSQKAAEELGLKAGTPITYRAGDQPNNALSLNVLRPGEIASTAGTSGVVYGVSDRLSCDRQSRVNTFAHVNYTREDNFLGILLCINGTGILNSWMKHNVVSDRLSYEEINKLASTSPVGSNGISILPFGNGAERILKGRNQGCAVYGLNFNTCTTADMLRASQEGIAFSLCYGMDIMKDMGMDIRTIKAGYGNMFLSPLFSEALSCVSGAQIQLMDTDGAAGAARGAGIGAGIYSSEEAFSSLKIIKTITPQKDLSAAYMEAYHRWLSCLNNNIQ